MIGGTAHLARLAEASRGRGPRVATGVGAEVDHRVGVDRPLIVAVFTIFAAYAVVVTLVANGAEARWGPWAAGGYGAAALLATWCWRRQPGLALLAALAGAFAIPAAILPDNLGATSEVRVVARAASLWLAHGTPYLAARQLVSWRSYDPYLPGMSIFGLPHALGAPGAAGDPLLWLAVATGGLLYASCRIASPGAARRCGACRRQALLRALLLVSCPVFALPMSLGVTDPPVIALLCLGLASAVPSIGNRAARGTGVAAVWAAGHAEPRIAPQLQGQPLLSGLSVGVACALKATAWPALPVILALVAVRSGSRAAAHFAASSLATFLSLTALTAPRLLAHPRALWLNVVEYPLGLSSRPTPAASPLPGHLLASTGSLGHIAAIMLLGGAAFAVAVSLVLRPPRDATQAATRLAVGLVALFLLAPDSRFGYFAYPLGILFWLLLSVPTAFRTRHRSTNAETRRCPLPAEETSLYR